MLKKTPESPLDCKKIKPVNAKGNQSSIFLGRTVAEAEAPILWPPDMKSQLIGIRGKFHLNGVLLYCYHFSFFYSVNGQLLGEATWGWDHRVAPE